MGKDVCIKAGTFCPVCKSIPLADCWHSAGEFNSGNVSYRFDTLTARVAELEAECAKLNERDAEMDEGVGLMRDRITELEAENAKLARANNAAMPIVKELTEDLERRQTENARLREALQPFADAYPLCGYDLLWKHIDGEGGVSEIVLEDLQRAAATLNKETEAGS